MFAYVKCKKCGRTLRAQRSPNRTTIRCWDCRSEVVVPRFRSPDGPKPVARLRGAMNSARGESIAAIILLALAATAAIAVPRAGGVLALGLLISTALGYIRRIEEPGRALESEEEAEASGRADWRPGRLLGRLILASVFVVGLVAVPWLADGSRQLEYVAPVLPPPTLPVVGLLLWLILPFVVFLLTARDEHGPIGPRRALAAAFRRRWRTLGALLAPLVAIAVVEAALLGGLLLLGDLPVFVLDLFPVGEGDRVETGIYVLDNSVEFDRTEGALKVYVEGLGRGATLLGSVPTSFRRGLQPRLIVPAYGELKSEGYVIARLLVAMLGFLTAFAALAIQSTWLGRIGLAAPRPEEEQPEDEAEAEAEGDREPERGKAVGSSSGGDGRGDGKPVPVGSSAPGPEADG
ncbi:hypothetical protein [Tautonia sociabilis]|uniref:Uncharacterized protein n=1 Tax=Tautonia sociabilis TaxID=2080755 RepID=A0A432MD60_9BACT|nr:hypothetical protein [Tautonia sociabilis]RUL81612.1 hypothetical protein TsocGM_24920 [Tautonia sociabilis]